MSPATRSHETAPTTSVSRVPASKPRDLDVESQSNPCRASSTDNDPTALTCYPSYCHKVSKTWFSWVKLTAYDVHHRLEARAGFRHSLQGTTDHFRNAPQVLFYLNHPIQFVQVAGVVVNFEEHFKRFWLLTIDDSSGSTIDVVCQKPEEDEAPVKKARLASLSRDHDAAVVALSEEADRLAELLTTSVQIGTILQVKGTVTLFHRNVAKTTSINEVAPSSRQAMSLPNRDQRQHALRQINAHRIAVLSTAAAELAFVAARNALFEGVLSQPWVLSSRRQRLLQVDAQSDVQKKDNRTIQHLRAQRHRQSQAQANSERIAKAWEEEEQLRHQQAMLAKQAGQTLHTSSLSRPPSDSPFIQGSRDSERLSLLKNAFG